MRAVAILGDVARIVHPAEGDFDLSGCDTAVDAIVSIITRHPMHEDELVRALERWTPGQVQEALEALALSGKAQVVERYGARFWSASASRYPDEARSTERRRCCHDNSNEKPRSDPSLDSGDR
jgi:hypothetical protein